MPLPTSYTEKALAEYMDAEIDLFRVILGWQVAEDGPGSYQQPVNDTLRAYGVATVEEATDIGKLEALASWQVWRRVVRNSAHLHPTQVNGVGGFSPQTAYDHAKEQLAYAEAEARQYRTGWGVTRNPIVHRGDPYVYLTDEERTVAT